MKWETRSIFAASAIEEAEYAVLDAVWARKKADALAGSA
jgi:hypothetical protein